MLPKFDVNDDELELSFEDECEFKSIEVPKKAIKVDKKIPSNDYLMSITVSTSVSSLKDISFDCNKLTSITIPDSVKNIDHKFFDSCPNLKIIYTNQIIRRDRHHIPIHCRILQYEKSHELNLKLEPIEIKPIQINPPQITDDYKPNLPDYNEYIKERIELINNYQNNSIVKYHESIIDIAKDFNGNVEAKELEIKEYIKLLRDYKSTLSKLSLNLSEKINQHTLKLEEIEKNNYKLPCKHRIHDKLNSIIIFEEDVNFNTIIKLNNNYYYKDDLIIPYEVSPYTEIYKLPCKFTEITPENKRILTKAEKKTALLSINYNCEYIDLSNTDIQYFIDTFKNCLNLKEIRYPDSTEYK